jgi:DNA-binding IclR family transcriptional regulator
VAGRATGPPGRSVANKLFTVLDAFSAGNPQLSLNEMAQRAGLPLSTTYRLATELVEWGGLERGPGPGYRVGQRLWELGALALCGSTVHTLALPYMFDLYEATHENVHLAVLDGREALYVQKVSGRRSIPVRSRLAGRLPLHATGVGRVLLAHAPPQLLDDLLERGLERFTAHTVVAPKHLRRVLSDVRRTGVAYARDELTLGTTTVAAPVFDALDSVVAALGVVVRSSASDARRLAPAVRCATISISRQLRASAVTGVGSSGDGSAQWNAT